MVAFAQVRGKSATATVTPREIWDALRSAGASPTQAAGIMGNMVAESQLNPEAVNPKGAYGLVQWTNSSYPQAASLVTGDPAHDLVEQVKFLAQTGGFRAAKGTTPAQAASNFAALYERCKGCEHGGSQNTTRQANASTVAGWATAGNWPSSSGGATDQAQLTSSQTAEQKAECWLSLGTVYNPIPSWVPLIGGGSTTFCLLGKSQARGIEAIALMAAGALTMALGLNMVMQASGAYERTEDRAARLASTVKPP